MKDFWNGLQPVTRCFLIGGVVVLLIAAMYFGVIDKDVVNVVIKAKG